MLNNLGNVLGVLKNAGKIREQAAQMNERLSAARIVGESGAGQVRATVDGKGELIAIQIEPALVSGGDAELVEDLVVTAVRDAVHRSREAARKEMEVLSGGLGFDLGGVIDSITKPR